MKNKDNTYTIILYFDEDELRKLKKLSKKLQLNDYETIKHAIQLVSWWSKNE